MVDDRVRTKFTEYRGSVVGVGGALAGSAGGRVSVWQRQSGQGDLFTSDFPTIVGRDGSAGTRIEPRGREARDEDRADGPSESGVHLADVCFVQNRGGGGADRSGDGATGDVSLLGGNRPSRFRWDSSGSSGTLDLRKKFPNVRMNFVVGKPKFGLPDYQDLLGESWTPFEIPTTEARDPAAIIFTSGSTGPAKGVEYEHGMFSCKWIC